MSAGGPSVTRRSSVRISSTIDLPGKAEGKRGVGGRAIGIIPFFFLLLVASLPPSTPSPPPPPLFPSGESAIYHFCSLTPFFLAWPAKHCTGLFPLLLFLLLHRYHQKAGREGIKITDKSNFAQERKHKRLAGKASLLGKKQELLIRILLFLPTSLIAGTLSAAAAAAAQWKGKKTS